MRNKKKSVCGRTDTNGTARRPAGEFHRNIRDHLRYFQRVGLCPAGEKEKQREKGRKSERRVRRGKETGGRERAQTSRPDLHSERRRSSLRDRPARGYFSASTYLISYTSAECLQVCESILRAIALRLNYSFLYSLPLLSFGPIDVVS